MSPHNTNIKLGGKFCTKELQISRKVLDFQDLEVTKKTRGRYEVRVKLIYWQRFGGKDEVPQKVERLDVIPTSTRKDAIRRAKDRLRSKNTVRAKVVDTDTGKVIFDAVP